MNMRNDEPISDWDITQDPQPPPEEPNQLKGLAAVGIMILCLLAVNRLVLGKQYSLPPR